MNIEVDTHTHTIASGHAYSTLNENIKAAKKKKLKMIAVTDHGPSLLGAPSLTYFNNLKIIPNKVLGITVLKGVEANIIDFFGNTDMKDVILKTLDFNMVGFHSICLKASNIEDNTRAMVNALKNPYYDTVSHPGNPKFPVDIKKIVETAKEYGKAIEINNHSFKVRKGSEINCKEFLINCKELAVPILCGSDAHICDNVGKFNYVKKLIKEVDFPEELILSTSEQKVKKYLLNRRKSWTN